METKPRLLLWKDITLSQIESINNTQDNNILRNNLLKIFDTGSYDSEIKQEIIVDLFFYAFKFCKAKNFTEEQISVNDEVLHRIIYKILETSFDNSEKVFQFFNECLLLHSVHRPPFSLEIFNSAEFQIVSDYVLDTYFRHFKMYKYAFTSEVVLDLSIDYPNIKQEEVQLIENEQTLSINEDVEVDQQQVSNEELVNLEKEEESESIKELRKFIRSFLTDELKKIKAVMDDKLKMVKETISSKIASEENETGTKNKKIAKGSANKSKKK